MNRVFPAVLAPLALLALLSACAAVPPASDPAARAQFFETNDRLEPLNRVMFDIDQGLDKVLVNPAISAYHETVPDGARRALLDFQQHLGAPVTFVHDVLQGKLNRAGETLARFVINSAVGFFGFFDVGAKWGIPYHSEDFGQTLAAWGVGDGSYVYVPLLGPTSIRDGIGYLTDSFAVSPVAWYSYNPRNAQWVQYATLGHTYVVQRDDNHEVLEELKKSSIDYYAALRSAYRQTRAKEIRDGAPPPLEDLEAPE